MQAAQEPMDGSDWECLPAALLQVGMQLCYHSVHIDALLPLMVVREAAAVPSVSARTCTAAACAECFPTSSYA
jgi:hypothetical protein